MFLGGREKGRGPSGTISLQAGVRRLQAGVRRLESGRGQVQNFASLGFVASEQTVAGARRQKLTAPRLLPLGYCSAEDCLATPLPDVQLRGATEFNDAKSAGRGIRSARKVQQTIRTTKHPLFILLKTHPNSRSVYHHNDKATKEKLNFTGFCVCRTVSRTHGEHHAEYVVRSARAELFVGLHRIARGY